MASVFRRLHRLRKLEERTAQVALADAHAQKESCEAEVITLEERLDRSHEAADGDASRLAWHHRFALDGEMARRSAVHELRSAEAQVQTAHGEVVHRATQARTVEILAEATEERERVSARKAEERMFDEVGSQRWLRRAS